ncbi:phosphatidate cytidylyltransferase [Desulfopila aestuarii]|uniref:Phosphatidate cytidylyltransferase n=1 Tax=Desulfopila aestuarii DSM 18488 TaxID=1121416 RepID=A0A1M7Y058_9BACT|nr:phosphatidate cytidylyltransferase [Desulfopila aestuarii]SHO44891.1 phosphatidate cytidylyltransferase [Desulfopila aestuarii DSM 18488]
MKRTLPGILLAVCWVVLLVKGSTLQFYLAMLVITAIGGAEYLKMIMVPKLAFFSRLYLVGTICLPVLLTLPVSGTTDIPQQIGLFSAFFLVTLYFLRCYTHFDNTYERFSRMVFGVVYVGVLASYLVLLRQYPEGGSWLVVLTAVTAGSDSGAYYFGSTFGKRKLCPNISPKKTVEGALGGLLCGLAAAFVSAMLLLEKVDWLFVGMAAVILTGVGILGDLTESVIKRGTGTKDSGTLLAGHGGVLDRIDSLLLAAPVLYYLLLFLGGE